MDTVTIVIAHQGGWDEMLFVLLPIALFAGLLAMANRRASALQAEREHPDDDAADQAEPAGGEPDEGGPTGDEPTSDEPAASGPVDESRGASDPSPGGSAPGERPPTG